MSEVAILVIAAVVGTTVLLALGFSAGFWAGFQAAVSREADALAERKAREAEEKSILASQTIVPSAANQTGADPGQVALGLEVCTSINRLLTTISTLQQRLQELDLPAAAVAGQSLALVPEARTPQPPKHPLRLMDDSQLSDAELTRQEMRDVIGTRHHLIENTDETAPRRYTFECQQLVAPWGEGEPLPEPSRYVSVQCREISVTGISFLWRECPTFTRAVISIGAPHREIYMVVQVLRYRAVYMHNSVCNLVECEFVSRLERETSKEMVAAGPDCD